MIVCVAGNPAIDKLFEVETIRSGAIHRPDVFVPLPGGKGIHVAQVATALGADAIATGILGGHHGRWLSETLADEGVPGVFAWAAAGETRSCLTVADRATGGLTEFYEDGITATPEDWAALAAIVDELMRQNARWLAMAGSVPATPGVEGYAQLVRAARAAGVRSAVDSRGADLARAIEEHPDLVKINAAEACELLETPADDLDNLDDMTPAREAAQAIRERAGGDGHAVVVTLGEQGMVLIDPAGDAWHGAVATRGDYPVGSGDAFLAGLLTALGGANGADQASAADDWAQAAALGLGAAAANAEVPGAARIEPARARELAAAAEIRRLAPA
ncbi:MAG TPA: PfkB family carbohydrate kinase [Solirubrobacteraceae bacterium]|nr:PfkB family carbohydrate kinase [Solirubrobacteraceae bacterium]